MAKCADPIEQCSCGLWYPVGGAALCVANRHGKLEAPFGAHHRHVNHLELTTEVYCAECSARISATMKLEGSAIVLHVQRHICPVEEPDQFNIEIFEEEVPREH